jgi:glucose/arabinose dehydrogenase
MHKTNRTRNTLAILSFALASTLAAPAAFAQSAPANPQDPAAQAVPQQAATEATPQATEAAPQAKPAQKSWNDLDANGNGSLSVTEAAPIESLTKVFAKADKDGNGELTADEYKAWLAANGNKPKAGQG